RPGARRVGARPRRTRGTGAGRGGASRASGTTSGGGSRSRFQGTAGDLVRSAPCSSPRSSPPRGRTRWRFARSRAGRAGRAASRARGTPALGTTGPGSLRRGSRAACATATPRPPTPPNRTLAHLPADGVVVWAVVYDPVDTEPRPIRLDLRTATRFDCCEATPVRGGVYVLTGAGPEGGAYTAIVRVYFGSRPT